MVIKVLISAVFLNGGETVNFESNIIELVGITHFVLCVRVLCVYERFDLRLHAQDVGGVFVDTIAGREEPSDDVIELGAGDEHGAFLSFSIGIFLFTEAKFKFGATVFSVFGE